MFLLKILNPFIWLWNAFCYGAHLDFYAQMKKYEPYDFSKDVRYF